MHMISRVRSTGQLIESQECAGAISPETLCANAVASGHSLDAVEVIEVDDAVWRGIKKQSIDDPAIERIKASRLTLANDVAAIQTKLGLTDSEMATLQRHFQATTRAINVDDVKELTNG